MPTHPLVDTTVLNRLRAAVSRFGNRIVERVPTADELSDFFSELDEYTGDPIGTHLLYNAEDGSVYVHRAASSATVNLCTVSHDYTRVGREPYRENDWSDVRGDDAASHAVSMLDSLQRHLLYYKPAYFHSAGVEVSPASSSFDGQSSAQQSPNTTYTLRTAYRRANHAEPITTEARAMAWRPLGWTNGLMRRATPAEATVWAICHVIPTDPCADMPRLRHVRATIRAVFDMFPKRRSVPNGNSLALLASRLPVAHDPYGRVRYPLIRAAACDQALLGTDSMPGPSATGYAMVSAQEEPKRALPLFTTIGGISSGVDSGSLLRMFCSVVFLAAFIAIALYYTLGDRPRTALIQWVLWGLVVLTAGEILLVFFSLFRKPKTIKSLVNAARTENVRLQVDIATSPAARAFFNGHWLSFSGDTYTGKYDYNGRKFTASDLMAAGFETTFSMDGREGLITPWGQGMRLERLDESGGAIYKIVESDSPQLGTAIAEGVRGTWLSDVVTGGHNNLSAPSSSSGPTSVYGQV